MTTCTDDYDLRHIKTPCCAKNVLSIISILETMIAQATSIVKAIPIEF
jgi:hypothetical protein